MLDIFTEPSNFELQCGCYAVNKEIKQLHNDKHVILPVLESSFQVEIVNAIANVTITQKYKNVTEKFVELQYNFPVNPNACIYRFRAEFGTKVIEGVVKEKQEAKKQYQEAVNMGKHAALGQTIKDNKDVFNMKIGNVGPGQEIRIHLVYMQELSLSYSMFYQMRVMSNVSPAYLKSLSNEAIEGGFRNLQAKTQGKLYWDFKIVLKTMRKVVLYQSNSHKIEQIFQNDSQTQTVISLAKGEKTSKDFIFAYTTQEYQQPSYIFGRTDKSSTAMVSFIPKFCSLSADDAYKASVNNTPFQMDIESSKGEYIFFLDRSGSMSGLTIKKAIEALILFIKSLPKDTYFNIVSFGSHSEKLFPKSVKYNNKQVQNAIEAIRNMEADLGGTQIYNPLKQELDGQLIKGYPKQLFLLTDGGVSNTEGVIRMVGQKTKYARVHTIGLGSGASRNLIVDCAKKGKGYHIFIGQQQDPSEKIIQLLTDSLSPVITNISLEYDQKLIDSIIPIPQSLPYILKNELVNFYITFKGQLQVTTKIKLSYEDSQNKQLYKSTMQINPESENVSFIDRMGHYKKIQLLQQSYRTDSNIQDFIYFVKKVDKKELIIKESVQNQILSDFTAFVCVQKEVIDGKLQQIADRGQIKINVEPVKQIAQQYERFNFDYQKFNSICGGDRFKTLTSSRNRNRSPMSYESKGMVQLSCNYSSKKKGFQFPNPFSGALDKIGGFFKGIFAKQEQTQKFEAKSIQKQEIKIEKKQKKEKKQQKQKKEQSANVGINEVISSQDTQGFWAEISLIRRIFGKETAKIVENSKEGVPLITYLVAKWIEKNHPNKQYSLVVKKALNYCKTNSLHFAEYPLKYDKFVI